MTEVVESGGEESTYTPQYTLPSFESLVVIVTSDFKMSISRFKIIGAGECVGLRVGWEVGTEVVGSDDGLWDGTNVGSTVGAEVGGFVSPRTVG
mmetsp:Transcript_26179/g.38781  ORF Transcript_26179/g.38781 Transcript_26179/m.38781 type:complete len:94 (-) Transcript_26179:728-1009(-)